MGITVAVIGANGRMGALATALIEKTADLQLHAAIGSKDSLDAMNGADVALDFTLPHVSKQVIEHALANGLNIVSGTSGWSAERLAELGRTVAQYESRGVLIVPNFSIGSVVATSLATRAARFFDSIEIIEAHHPGKIDSPSGTAVRTAELIGEARADLGPVIAPHADQRARGQQVASVPIHSLRLAGVSAKQDVLFGGVGETLTISHETFSSTSYEAGILLALRAAPASLGLTVGLDTVLDLS